MHYNLCQGTGLITHLRRRVDIFLYRIPLDNALAPNPAILHHWWSTRGRQTLLGALHNFSYPLEIICEGLTRFFPHRPADPTLHSWITALNQLWQQLIRGVKVSVYHYSHFFTICDIAFANTQHELFAFNKIFWVILHLLDFNSISVVRFSPAAPAGWAAGDAEPV